MLTFLGYQYALAKDGIEGCNAYVRAKADGHPFAAILLDATIPEGLAGEEALKLILVLDSDPNARVILCSGCADSNLFKEAERVGFRGSELFWRNRLVSRILSLSYRRLFRDLPVPLIGEVDSLTWTCRVRYVRCAIVEEFC
jgi:hypothetical protein